MSKHLHLTLACGLLFACGPALAQEPALSRTAQDPRLEWGACPDFLPKGCEIAVLHGDPGKNNVDIFFKVPPDTLVPRHRHTSAERMVLVSGEMTVTYDGQEPEVLKPGTYAYGPAGLPHRAYCGKGDPCVLFIAFEAPLDAVPVEGASRPRGRTLRHAWAEALHTD